MAYDIKKGIHVWDPLIADAQDLLLRVGYDLSYDQKPGTMRVQRWLTRRSNDKYAPWSEMHAATGRPSLALLITLILGIRSE